MWSAAADNANWSSVSSWDGGTTVPGAGDSVTFNSTSVHTCNLDSLGAFNGSITIASTYSGTITQSGNVSGIGAYSQAAGTWNCNAKTFSCGANTWALSGGTFSGSSNTITTGAVTFSGGSLTATSGTWNLGGSWTLSNTPTFSANGGTINITAAATITDTRSTFNKFTINSSGAVVIAASTTIPLGSTPTTTVGSANLLSNNGTITYSGVWTHTGALTAFSSSTTTGSGSPSLVMAQNGNLTISASVTAWTSVNVTMNGSGGSGQYSDTAAKNSGTWTINTSGATSVAASTTMALGASPTTSVGAANNFTISGTATWTGTWNHTGTLTVSNGGTLTGTSTPVLTMNGPLTLGATCTVTNTIGTVNFNGSNSTTYTDTAGKLSASAFVVNMNQSFTVAASTTLPLGSAPSTSLGANTLSVLGTVTYSGAWSASHSINVGSGGTVTGSATPSLTLATGGALTINSAATGWTSVNVTVNGSAAGSYTDTAAKNTGTWTFSTSGGYTIAASTNCSVGASPSVSLPGFTFTINGTLSWSGTMSLDTALSVGSTGVLTGTSTPLITTTNNLTINATATITNPISTITFSTSANNPTLTDTGAKLSGNTTYVLNISGAHNFTVAGSTTCPLGANPTTNVGTGTINNNGTITYSGTWNHTGSLSPNASSTTTGTSSPALVLATNGSLTINSAVTSWTSVNVTVNGTSGGGTYTDTAGKNTGTWTINCSGANVTVGASTTMSLGTNPSSNVTAASIVVTGTLSWAGAWQHIGNLSGAGTLTGTSTPTLAIDGSLTASSFTVTNTIGTVTFQGSTISSTYTDTAGKLSASTFVINKNNNLIIAASTICALGSNPTSSVQTNFVSVSGTITYSGLWTLTGQLSVGSGGTVTGSASPALSITQDLTINSAATWTSVNITATGSTNLTYTDTAGKNTGTWTISKTLASTLTVAASTTMALGASPSSVAGQLTITGTVSGSSAWSHSGGITLSATGTISGLTSLAITEGAWTHTTGGVFPASLPITMTITSGSSRTFAGNGQTYGAFVRNGSGTGALTISGSNTFSSFTDTAAGAAHTLTLTAGTTQTAANWALSGAPGARLTINSTAGAATLHSTGVAPIDTDYATISNSTVDASPVWQAGPQSVNGGGNTNWIFDQPVSTEGGDNGRIGVHQMAVRSPHYLRKRRRGD